MGCALPQASLPGLLPTASVNEPVPPPAPGYVPTWNVYALPPTHGKVTIVCRPGHASSLQPIAGPVGQPVPEYTATFVSTVLPLVQMSSVAVPVDGAVHVNHTS